MKPARHRIRKAVRRRAHALRLDNHRPEGSERLSDIRKRDKARKALT
jgi:hypothetical protein